MEIHLKAWPHAKIYEGRIEQPCIIESYKLHYPFTLCNESNSYPKRVVWYWESRHPIQPLYFKHRKGGLYANGPNGNFYFHIYVSRKIDLSTLYWDTTIPNADTTPPPTMLEYFNNDERTTWGMTDTIRKHHGFFAIDPNSHSSSFPLRKVKNGWIQTEHLCSPRIPKLGSGDLHPSTKQIILFEKKVLATCSQDDEVKNDIIITPRTKKIPSFMFCSSLEDARKNINFTFLFPHPNLIDDTNEIKFIFDLKYEY